MKVRKQKDIPVANRIFTDREEPRAAFWKSYETYHQNMAEGESDIRVLNYYGIGGIGKSRLLKQLMTELDERISKPKYVYFDLNIHQESRAVLEALKNKLSSAYGFNFPLFELGVYNYAKKIGEDANAPEIKAYIEKSPFLSVLFSVAGKIPVASTAAEILSYADKGFAYARTYLLNHRKELVSIESKEATELYDYLPYLFAQDMTNNLEEAKKPMVLFLDTYERVVNEMASVGEPLNNDLWVRGEDGLVQNIPNVLWVIAGREKLKWERFDPEWNSALEQHILGNLGPVDSDSFLASAGVGGAKLRKQLYELTDGTPVYLDLCVDRFHDMTAKGIVPTIENFGDNLYSLIERFVRYMDDNKKDIVYVLACMQQWDDELITDIAGSVLANFSLSTYERVKDFSFIIESGDGLYNIHQTVGSVLLNNCPETIKLRTARKALEYYQKRLENKRVFEENYAEHLQQLIRFGLMVHTDTMKLEKFYQEQVSERLNELGKAGKVVHAEQMQEMLLEYTEENKESTFYAALIRDQAFFARCRGQYQESLDLAEKSVKLYQNLLGENHLETISALSAMAAGWYFLRQYENALEIDILVLQKRREFLGEEHPETLNALNAFAATLSSLDREEEALELHVQIHAKRKNLLGEDHPDTIISMNNMAISLDNLGQYEKALDLKTQVFEKRWNLLGETHLSTLSAMSSLATTLNNIGRYEEALDLLNQVYEKRREILGEDHENTIYAKNKLANTLFSLNRYEEASNLYHQVYEKRKEILGEDHIDTVDAMCNVARILSELNRYEEELQFEKLIFEKRKKLLGVNHKDTIDTMNNMSVTLMNLNRGEEAAKFGKWAFEKYREQLGENHPDTILALNNLVIVLGNLERYEEALEFSQLLCAKRREQFGEDHQKTISALGDLSRIFDELGQYSDALEVNKRLLENKRRTLGEDHPETIHMLNTLAWSYHQCGDPIPGVQLIERACQLAHENNSISTEEIISYEDTRAVLYADVGRLEEAYTLELSLIKKVQNEFAESKPLLAGCNFSAAYICEKKQDHVSALPYAEKAYPLFLEIFGQESKTTNECERMLDRIKVNVQSITSEI